MSTQLNIKPFVKKYLPLLFGLRVPGFLKIHLRYLRYSFQTWFVLFVAPFIVSIMCLRQISAAMTEASLRDIEIYLISLFVIAVLFFIAERNRKFRKAYVILIPALVILYGVLNVQFDQGRFPGNVIRYGVLTVLPAWWLWKHARGKGFQALSDGGEKTYREGRDLYMDGKYEEAFALLGPAAKRGHMKSLFLIGDSFEHGNGRKRDRVKGARFYDSAGRKGYKKAQQAFERLSGEFSEQERDIYDNNLDVSGINELF